MCFTYSVKETFQELKNPLISQCPAAEVQGSRPRTRTLFRPLLDLPTSPSSRVPCLDSLIRCRLESRSPALFHLPPRTRRSSCMFSQEQTGSERLRCWRTTHSGGSDGSVCCTACVLALCWLRSVPPSHGVRRGPPRLSRALQDIRSPSMHAVCQSAFITLCSVVHTQTARGGGGGFPAVSELCALLGAWEPGDGATGPRRPQSRLSVRSRPIWWQV